MTATGSGLGYQWQKNRVDMSQADNLVDLFKEITDLGTIEPLPDDPSLAHVRRFKVETASAESDLMDLFTFHVAREQVKFVAFGDAATVAATPPAVGRLWGHGPGCGAGVCQSAAGAAGAA